MNALLDIVQKLTDTQAAIRKTEELLRECAGDRVILANLESLTKRASKLEDEFLVASHHAHLDVCTYRMFAEEAVDYPILAVGTALSDLQRWFSIIYDALKNGPKKRAKLPPDVVQESTLNFAFSFTGSLGVALTIPSERMLFENDLQRAMQKTIEMLRADSSDQVLYFAKELGRASIHAFYRWIDDHVKAGTGADLKWLRERQEVASIRVGHAHMANLEKAIEVMSDTEERMIELTGLLVGADTLRHTFHMVFEEADEIRGTMSESIGKEYTVELPKQYFAQIRKSSFTNYATEQESIRYHLIALR